jgi:glycopeptide antibiotics resistance protein
MVVAMLYAIPGGDLPVVEVWDLLSFDKFAHFGVFALLALFLSVGLKRQVSFPILNRRALRSSALFCLIYGGLLEALQGILFEDRVSDWFDFAANALGVLFGLVIFRLLYGKEAI